MSIDTYMTVVPLVGIALTIPVWAYLWFTRKPKDPTPRPPR
jgi:hypothetical protein